MKLESLKGADGWIYVIWEDKPRGFIWKSPSTRSTFTLETAMWMTWMDLCWGRLSFVEWRRIYDTKNGGKDKWQQASKPYKCRCRPRSMLTITVAPGTSNYFLEALMGFFPMTMVVLTQTENTRDLRGLKWMVVRLILWMYGKKIRRIHTRNKCKMSKAASNHTHLTTF